MTEDRHKPRSTALLWAISAVLLTRASAAVADEAATKAAMIYNFGRFATWPDNRFAGPADPVVLCVDPADPLASSLAAVDGKSVGARNLVVKRTARFNRSCQIAYVSAAAANRDYLTALKSEGVLTVGETPDFDRFGAIRLITIGSQVRFEVNAANANQAGARLSSNLLRLAVTVR